MRNARSERSEKKYCLFCCKEIRPMNYFCSLKCELLHTKILNRRNEIRRKNILRKIWGGFNEFDLSFINTRWGNRPVEGRSRLVLWMVWDRSNLWGFFTVTGITAKCFICRKSEDIRSGVIVNDKYFCLLCLPRSLDGLGDGRKWVWFVARNVGGSKWTRGRRGIKVNHIV